MKKAALLSMTILCLAGLGGCKPVWREWVGVEKPAPRVAALPLHESWCYRTLGAIECYPRPQRLPFESLVSVDPPSRYPLTPEAHARAVADSLRPTK